MTNARPSPSADWLDQPDVLAPEPRVEPCMGPRVRADWGEPGWPQSARRDAGALRRAEVLDRILNRLGADAQPAGAIRAVLTTLADALGAEGAAVLDTLGATPGRSMPPSAFGPGSCALHQTGSGLAAVLDTALRLSASVSGADWDPVLGSLSPARRLAAARPSRQGLAPGGEEVLATLVQTRSGAQLALTLWQAPAGRPWDEDDALLVVSVANLALVMLEHEAMQRELALQARTDPLTGLLNRRAFLEELPRHLARLDRDEMPGTLIFADLDAFKPLNDRLGHDCGDMALRAVASMLRSTFRPTDLVARLGGDEFAVWLNGADQLTAAERAEALRVQAPRALQDVTGPDAPPVTLSIGIAERRTRSMEDLDSMFRRADQAMHDVKRAGRAHWRTAPAFEI